MKTTTQVAGAAKEAKGITKHEWGKVTRDTSKRVEGATDRLAGKLQRVGDKKRPRSR